MAAAQQAIAPPAGDLVGQIAATQEPQPLYWLALQALAADQPALARHALERVVALNPRFAGAWLDLAIASYRSGDPAAALEHLYYLRSQFVLTDALAAQVDDWVARCQNPGPDSTAKPAAWQGEITLGVGHDSNANTGIAHDQLTLTLPAGTQRLTVAADDLPRAASFTQQSLTLIGPAQPLGHLHATPLLWLGAKQYQTLGAFNTLELQTGVSVQGALAGGASVNPQPNWQASVLARARQQGGQPDYHEISLDAAYRQPLQTCLRSLGAGLATRVHPNTPGLGGQQISLSAQWVCPLPDNASLEASVQLGAERVRPDAPGGNNASAAATLRYNRLLTPDHSVHAMLQIDNRRDQQGYSPLLQDNARRQVQRTVLALSARQRIARQWQARLRLQTTRQTSNLPLFDQRSDALSLDLVYLLD